VVTAIFAAIMITNRDPVRRRSRVWLLVYVVLLTLCLASVLLPSLGGAGSSMAVGEGVTILSAQRLGDAEFTTLAAQDAAALSRWLELNSLRPLDSAAQVIVKDYVGRGWCFVVGKLARAGGGTNVPRPLVLTFPAKEPVFPMKLTALAGTTTRVELFIVGGGQAKAGAFHCAAADRMDPLPGHGEEYSETYMGSETGMSVGSPDVVPRMWPGCLAAAILCKGGRRPSRGEWKFVAALLAIVGVAGAVTWFSMATIPVRPDSGHLYVQYRWGRSLQTAAQPLAAEGVIRPGMTPAEVATIPQRMIDEQVISAEGVTNPFTGTRMRMERSPGNFYLRKRGGKIGGEGIAGESGERALASAILRAGFLMLWMARWVP
jgi:hypothetical protein